jgi:hypothetical protein
MLLAVGAGGFGIRLDRREMGGGRGSVCVSIMLAFMMKLQRDKLDGYRAMLQ